MSVSALDHKVRSALVARPAPISSIRPAVSGIPSAPRQTKSISAKKNYGAVLVGMAVVAALTFGLMIRSQEILVPGEGWGYRLGLIGGSMMLLLLTYPAFKRSRFFGRGTQAAFWFRFHMMLGLVGPLLILYHSNFSTGAMNSNVALFSMLLVAGSGVVGRYIYVHIHQGMSGARLDVGSLLAQATKLMLAIEEDVGGFGSGVVKAMAEFGAGATPKQMNLGQSLVNLLMMPVNVARARMQIMREVRLAVAANAPARKWSQKEIKRHVRLAKNHVDEFTGSVSRAAQFAFWERMFSLWHIIHVPLFFLLLVSGVIHVVAVHLY